MACVVRRPPGLLVNVCVHSNCEQHCRLVKCIRSLMSTPRRARSPYTCIRYVGCAFGRHVENTSAIAADVLWELNATFCIQAVTVMSNVPHREALAQIQHVRGDAVAIASSTAKAKRSLSPSRPLPCNPYVLSLSSPRSCPHVFSLEAR